MMNGKINKMGYPSMMDVMNRPKDKIHYDDKSLRTMFDRFFDLWALNNGRDLNEYEKDGQHWLTMWTAYESLDLTYDFDETDQTVSIKYVITDSEQVKWSEGETEVIHLTGEADDDGIDTSLSGDDSLVMEIENDFQDINQRMLNHMPNPMEH